MAKLEGSGEWASELARALGLDPSLSYDIVLYCRVNEVVHVEIKRFVNDSEKIAEVVRKVAWIEEPEKEEKDDCSNS